MLSLLQAFTHQSLHILGMLLIIVYPFLYGIDTIYVAGILTGILMWSFIISSYYHRHIAHRSWSLPNWLHYPLLTLGATFLMLPAFSWVAVHREHHRFTDTEKDPHGPAYGIIHNILTIFIKPKAIYLKSDSKDKKFIWQLNNYWKIFIIGSSLISLLISPLFYLLVLGYVFSSQVFVNFMGHYKQLRDSHLTSIFTGGEMYHKHHHDSPNDPRFGVFDIGYYGMIKWLRLKD